MILLCRQSRYPFLSMGSIQRNPFNLLQGEKDGRPGKANVFERAIAFSYSKSRKKRRPGPLTVTVH